MRLYAQVIVDVVHSRVERPFTYEIPTDCAVDVGTRVLVPFGHRSVEGLVIGMTDEAPADMEIKPIIHALDGYPAVLPCLLQLAEELAVQNHCPLSETLRLLIPAEMRKNRIREKKETVARLAIPLSDLPAALRAQKAAQKRQTVLNLLADGEEHPISEMRELVRNPLQPLQVLAGQGLVRLDEKIVFRAPYAYQEEQKRPDPVLTEEQQSALMILFASLAARNGRFLLHGVTGSGKTEVYIRLVRKCLESGKGAIILVPEIALTPQMVSWFRERFGPGTAVLHSALSAGQRFDEWRRIRFGHARVVIGARSAVFAPVENLGLIVVDEEHESTYQSEGMPLYDARDVAMRRGELEGATVLLASATPSILSFARANRGDYTLLEMKHRVRNLPLPSVEIVDMREELEAGNRSIFSSVLFHALQETIADGRQAILFLNRRGYSPSVACRKCGETVKCANCDIAMTFHQYPAPGRMRCHYCGAEIPVPKTCPSCGSTAIRYFGIGTQKVEEELRRLFPGVGVIRMDQDTTSVRDGHAKLLEQFRAGRAQILIGTQMIAKGLDFPKVNLVGVILADLTLNLPDYRSSERTFQLLTQVAGRAGRADGKGRVIIQTYQPENSVILAAQTQDYRAFFHQEFQRRRSGLYPPFTMMCRLLVEQNSGEEAEKISQSLFDSCQEYLNVRPEQKKRVLVLRLDDAPVKLLRGKTRRQVLIKCFDNPHVQPFLDWLKELEKPIGVYLEINPQSMM